MIIDLHCHTKKAKDGDVGREVTKDLFKQKINENGVGIVAITNHNIFDLTQYEEFVKENSNILILPGIELDVTGNKSGKNVRGHVIVIIDPKDVTSFSKLIESKCNCSPNDYVINIEDFCNTFGKLENAIIMCHYKKEKAISFDDFQYIKNNVDYSSIAILEPSNARKAGIIIRSEKECSWFGSDHHNWDLYPNDGDDDKKLPETIFNINNFNSLIQLLKNNQDALLLKSYLNVKGPETVEITPFADCKLSFNLYKDVNVIFGGKASGKTEILKSIEKYFIEHGKQISKFYIEDKVPDLKVLLEYKPHENNFSVFREKSCDTQLSIIRNWTWKEIPTLSSFFKAKKTEQATALLKKAKIVNAKFSDLILEDKVVRTKEIIESNKDKIDKVIEIDKTQFLSKDEIMQLDSLLLKLNVKGKEKYLNELFQCESKKLEKFSINFIGKRITDLQGVAKAPSNYGFIQVYEEINKIDNAINDIRNSLTFNQILPKVVIGELPSKGKVYRTTNIGFKQQNTSKHSEFKRQQVDPVCKANDVKNFEKILNVVNKNKNDINEYLRNIDNLKKYIVDNDINSLMYFLNYSNIYSTATNLDYKPSNGEASILLVDFAINNSSSDVIILDEPDSGMGADYINDILINDIKKQAKNNKIIIISTHEPNLVVRTHPYQCIFREEYEPTRYKTYIGSSFEEYLHNVNDFDDRKKWVDTCIDKCEGGNYAIKERERTYGHY